MEQLPSLDHLNPGLPVRRRRRRCNGTAYGTSHDDGPSLKITLRTKGHGMDKYPAKSHAQRVAKELATSKGLIVLAGIPTTLYSNSDNPVPFRQDRYFFYLTGCNEPNCYVTYEIAHDKLTLWLPSIDESRVVWSGRGSTVEEALERYDVDEAKYIVPSFGRNHGESKYLSLLGERLYAQLWSYSDRIGRASGAGGIYVRQDIFEPWLDSHAKKLKFQHALDACRVIKDEQEIALIRRANEITAEAHIAVLQNLHRFGNEAEVEAAYMSVCIAKHAKQQAYSPIAGSGPNASVLHYVSNDEDFGDRQMMVMDAGCEVSCYASDVTRSFPLNARSPGCWPSKEAEDVYKLVEKVQEACIKEMKPGKPFLEIVRLSREMTLDGLLELGVLKGEREDIWKAGTVAGFFPHGLGHHLGLEVHDVSPVTPPPTTSSTSTPQELYTPSPLPPIFDFTSTALYSTSGPALEPGMVVTIEPGVYFNHFLLEKFFLSNSEQSTFIDKDVLDRYWKVGGVRIEDDVLITRNGYKNLTTAPKGEAMLGIIREGAKSS